MHGNQSPLRPFQTAADTTLERVEAGLSNAASTTAWKPRSGECLACKRAVGSAGLSVRPLTSRSAALVQASSHLPVAHTRSKFHQHHHSMHARVRAHTERERERERERPTHTCAHTRAHAHTAMPRSTLLQTPSAYLLLGINGAEYCALLTTY